MWTKGVNQGGWRKRSSGHDLQNKLLWLADRLTAGTQLRDEWSRCRGRYRWSDRIFFWIHSGPYLHLHKCTFLKALDLSDSSSWTRVGKQRRYRFGPAVRVLYRPLQIITTHSMCFISERGWLGLVWESTLMFTSRRFQWAMSGPSRSSVTSGKLFTQR